jgi:hypothetical protein
MKLYDIERSLWVTAAAALASVKSAVSLNIKYGAGNIVLATNESLLETILLLS